MQKEGMGGKSGNTIQSSGAGHVAVPVSLRFAGLHCHNYKNFSSQQDMISFGIFAISFFILSFY
jgi:hypothetical protein